ncbi:uncharacterized protein LOC115923113 [Strongylocentrotus purpuratus]|uniref:Uncharacterized protein n=1 Tax=Strongylocentrotus purpuratus TaxID=7668 RepID=A0A7M7NNS3_STRPU|nr:uncharacterized protein LOC115923113 [Strongylocentrotus purpuratus]
MKSPVIVLLSPFSFLIPLHNLDHLKHLHIHLLLLLILSRLASRPMKSPVIVGVPPLSFFFSIHPVNLDLLELDLLELLSPQHLLYGLNLQHLLCLSLKHLFYGLISIHRRQRLKRR